NEILFDGVGSAVAETEVVLGGTTLVAMAFDGDLDGRVRFQVISGFRERRTSVGTNVGLIVVEIGVAHFTQEEFILRWPRRRRRRWRRRDGFLAATNGKGSGGERDEKTGAVERA